MFGIKKSDSAKPEAEEVAEVQPLPQAIPETAVEVEKPEPAKYGKLFKQAPSQILKPTIISEGFELVGDMRSSGGVHIEGTITGTLNLDIVTIGQRGKVKGSIHCKKLHIKGHFSGDAVCGELTIAGSATVDGKISYRSILMESGAVLTGELKHNGQ